MNKTESKLQKHSWKESQNFLLKKYWCKQRITKRRNKMILEKGARSYIVRPIHDHRI
uniref:Uncharacterized protein n=1 Tax=Rhizophora mucronata TaxID=61149 RepID=A0A2P2NGW9_RHIMU